MVVATAITWGIALLLPKELTERPIPLSVPLIASTIMLATSAGVRYIWRLVYERALRPTHDAVERMVVIGAGEGGQQIITSLLRTPMAATCRGRHRRRSGQAEAPHPQRAGGRHPQRPPQVAERYGAEVALLAIPSAIRR